MSRAAFDAAALVHDYGDPFAEASACRRDCALFDFSFVSRAVLRGQEAAAAIGRLTRRSLAGLAPGRVRYALREDADGRVRSDLTIWRHGAAHFEVMSGDRSDVARLEARAGRGVQCLDATAETAILALQGPGALRALAGLGRLGEVAALPYFGFCRTRLAGVDCIIGRLGYTGEPGFEILCAREWAARLWDRLAERARPAGFAAADMLRIEAGFVLFANEFRVPVTAEEAGLARFADGTDRRRERPVRLVCFRARTETRPVLWQPAGQLDRPARSGALVVTSACHSLAAGGTLGLGFALASDVREGAALADPSGTFGDIRLVSRPFYDRAKRRPRRPWPAAGGP